LELDPLCYPADFGLVRIFQIQGRSSEALAQLNNLLTRYPDNLSVKKQQARYYTAERNWQRADTLIQAVLAQNSRDGEFLLLRAKVLLEQGFFQQAQQPLDAYARIDNTNRSYIFLRSRLQAEGLRNRTNAINLLRPLVRSNPDDPEIAIYLASLLMESGRREDVDEGRRILNRFLGEANTAAEALSLAAADSVKREAWIEAKTYYDRLLPRRRNSADLLNAWKTERALGNNAAALSHARDLYNRDNPDDEAVSAYVISLIDTGRSSEAARIIDQRLPSVPGGIRKSRYYYLRSRVRSDEDAVLNDLRSALFEDPKNLDALMAMFEVYHRKKDERRAVYYLKQAIALAPDNPQINRYAMEYRSLLQ
jgi:thioredoxin-like negative regulator of GroEL